MKQHIEDTVKMLVVTVCYRRIALLMRSEKSLLRKGTSRLRNASRLIFIYFCFIPVSLKNGLVIKISETYTT